MTVILFARATNGYAVAADGRTCSPNLPKSIETDDAEKVRVHYVGEGGYVTASSGRAWIGGEPISTIEKAFVNDRSAEGAGISGPDDFVNHLRQTIESYNEAQPCDCNTRYGQCVVAFCNNCGIALDCPRCLAEGIPYEWTEPGEDLGECPCSPGSGEPSTTPPELSWCRCKAIQEADLIWLCVPFGPDAIEPVTATISGVPSADDHCDIVERNFLLHGELASKHPDFDKPVVSVTANRTDEEENKPIVDIRATAIRLRSLLCGAYTEAADNAALRVLRCEPLSTADLGIGSNAAEVTVPEVAIAIRKYKHDNGVVDLGQEVGAASIGGVSMMVIIEDGEPTTHTAPDDGLPVTWT
jgi:hypothetical protein